MSLKQTVDYLEEQIDNDKFVIYGAIRELADRVEELHRNNNANTQALRKDFEALLNHLGLELANIPKQKVIQKKGK